MSSSARCVNFALCLFWCQHHRCVFFFNTALSIWQVFAERPSVILTTLPFSISSSVSQKQPFPDWFSRLCFRRKLLNMNLTFGLATRPSARLWLRSLGRLNSICWPRLLANIDLLPPRSRTPNRVPTLPLLAFCRNTKRTSCFTSPSVPYNLKHVFVSLKDVSLPRTAGWWELLSVKSTSNDASLGLDLFLKRHHVALLAIRQRICSSSVHSRTAGFCKRHITC